MSDLLIGIWQPQSTRGETTVVFEIQIEHSSLSEYRREWDRRQISVAILEHHDREAADFFISLLKRGCEVALENDLDEGNEGLTIFRRSFWLYQMRIGGHGWSGGWKILSKTKVRNEIIALADLNRGGIGGCPTRISHRWRSLVHKPLAHD